MEGSAKLLQFLLFGKLNFCYTTFNGCQNILLKTKKYLVSLVVLLGKMRGSPKSSGWAATNVCTQYLGNASCGCRELPTWERFHLKGRIKNGRIPIISRKFILWEPWMLDPIRWSDRRSDGLRFPSTERCCRRGKTVILTTERTLTTLRRKACGRGLNRDNHCCSWGQRESV